VTGQAAGEVLRTLTGEARSRVGPFRETPVLLFVCLHRGVGWIMESPPVPTVPWGRQPDEALYALAEAAAANRRRLGPVPGLYAVGFRTPAVYAATRYGIPQPGRLARGAGQAPGRAGMRAARSTLAVDRVGNAYGITVFRDTGETRSGILSRSDPARASRGRALAALDLMIRAYLGVDLPLRPGSAPPEPEP